MQKVVLDEPYEFIPPFRTTRWIPFFKRILRWNLKRLYGIVEIDCQHLDRMQQSIDAGHGVLLCPNHCRPSDPLSLGMITVLTDQPIYSMASWHIFKESRLTEWIIKRAGAFSIYREGMDRQSLNCAIDIVKTAERPLVIFPEGMVSRTNGVLTDLMDGTAFIARTAAKKRAAEDPNKKVVIHPVGMRYEFLDDVETAIEPTLREIEQRLTWQPAEGRPLPERIGRILHAILSLREMEYMGSAQTGNLFQRAQRVVECMLNPLEEEWLGEPQSGDVVARVKALRSAILPDMIRNEVTDEERKRRWSHLTAAYYAQQVSTYPSNYFVDGAPQERLLEIVEKIEEDLTDKARVYGRMKLTIEIGEPITVPPQRQRGPDGDPVMNQLKSALEDLLAPLHFQPEHQQRPPIASAG